MKQLNNYTLFVCLCQIKELLWCNTMTLIGGDYLSFLNHIGFHYSFYCLSFFIIYFFSVYAKWIIILDASYSFCVGFGLQSYSDCKQRDVVCFIFLLNVLVIVICNIIIIVNEIAAISIWKCVTPLFLNLTSNFLSFCRSKVRERPCRCDPWSTYRGAS